MMHRARRNGKHYEVRDAKGHITNAHILLYFSIIYIDTLVYRYISIIDKKNLTKLFCIQFTGEEEYLKEAGCDILLLSRAIPVKMFTVPYADVPPCG